MNPCRGCSETWRTMNPRSRYLFHLATKKLVAAVAIVNIFKRLLPCGTFGASCRQISRAIFFFGFWFDDPAWVVKVYVRAVIFNLNREGLLLVKEYGSERTLRSWMDVLFSMPVRRQAAAPRLVLLWHRFTTSCLTPSGPLLFLCVSSKCPTAPTGWAFAPVAAQMEGLCKHAIYNA